MSNEYQAEDYQRDVLERGIKAKFLEPWERFETVISVKDATGWSWQEVATAFGVSFHTVMDWQRKKSVPAHVYLLAYEFLWNITGE
jgi:DNA-binding transcriptional regulator YiaG